MCADRDTSSSPGLRASVGRFLHGLLPYRLLQLLGAVWTYVMGLWGSSLLSLLPSGWVIQRQVGPGELPEVLEALWLRPGHWEELEELSPFKELITPGMEGDILGSWKGFVPNSKEQDTWESALDDLGSWQKTIVHSNMQVLWEAELDSWEDFVEPIQDEDECHKKVSANHALSCIHPRLDSEDGFFEVSHEKPSPLLCSSTLGMVSCIFTPGSSEVLTWAEQKKEEKNENNVDVFENIPYESKSTNDIQHIRNKRLWFLQQNQALEVLTQNKMEDLEVKENKLIKDSVMKCSDTDKPAINIVLELQAPEWQGSRLDKVPNQSKLLAHMNQSKVQKLPDQECRPCHQLSVLVQKPDPSDNIQNLYPPSPDQDQGYHSLEDWQCLDITKNLQTGEVGMLEKCEVFKKNVSDNPTKPKIPSSEVKDLTADQDSDLMDSDLEDKIPFPSVPTCTNKHIGFILGTVESDDEEGSNSSNGDDDNDEDWDEDDKDDGFDSEGSCSVADCDTHVLEGAVIWESFRCDDPYNPQNFTATLQTCVVPEENTQAINIEEHFSDSEESWCDSDAVSDSNSEDECSIDDEENQKLWNAFFKSDDPYNPLCFKASVHTAQTKKTNCNNSSKHLKLACSSLPNCELTLATILHDDQEHIRFRETNNVPREESANSLHKKVTFQEKVTIYYVCNEEERKGPWEEFARDRCRFQRRIQETETTIEHCLSPDHRHRVWDRMQEKWGS